jgi:hypothetical protein
MYVYVMDKDKRFEMRLPSSEYERLAKMAKGREQSVASLLREAALALWPIKDDPSRARVKAAAREMTPETVVEVVAGTSEAQMGAKEITTLARQRHGHLPLQFAERKVREELDADS